MSRRAAGVAAQAAEGRPAVGGRVGASGAEREVRAPAGHLYALPGGGFRADIRVRGERRRRRFRDAEQARAWLAAQAADGGRNAALSAAQIAEAAAAFALLPEGVGLVDTVRRALGAAADAADAPLEALAERYLADRARELRQATLAQYRQALAALSREAGTLREVDEGFLRRHVAGKPPYARNYALRAISAFFGWCRAQGLCSANPCAAVKLARTPPPRREILSLADAQRLLVAAAKADDRALLPYVALGLFAGIRPAEAMRLCADDVGEEWIAIRAEAAKTAQARTVAIAANLRGILDRHPLPSRGQLVPASKREGFRRRVRRLAADASVDWSQDVLRHSYASYAYERRRDAAAVAYEMGHRGTDVFFRHYRGLVSPGDGERFFSLDERGGEGEER